MNQQSTAALSLAAAAPDGEDDEPADVTLQVEGQRDLHYFCECWAAWVRTRRMYVNPSLPVSVLGKLSARGTKVASDGPDAIASAELAAFHLAMLGQPMESLDRRVFELHYYWRVRNVKAAAAEMGIGRQHWYRLVRDFRARVYACSRDILGVNLAAAEALPSRKAGTS